MAERRYRAPGRVNLIGEHTDYTGGLVLPAAIDRGITLDVLDVGGPTIVVDSATQPGTVRVDVDTDDASPGGPDWGRYVAAVAAELRAVGVAVTGFRGTLRADLPDGAGLSSSAALEVVLATALLDLADPDVGPFDLVDRLDVARLGQRAEHRAVGVPTGIMDQAAILLGRAGHAVLLDTATLDHELVPLPDGVVLLVVDSGVRRQLEHSGYGRRRAELEASFAALDGRAVADLAPSDLPAITARLAEVPARRLRHVVTENARVRAARDVLAAPEPDLEALGALFAAGHASMRDDFEASHPALDTLVDLALRHGAVAARMTGGGFGGAVVALVPDADVDARVAALLDDARAAGLDAVAAHRCVAADGAGRLAA